MEETNEDKEAYMAWVLSQMVDGELNKQQTREMIHALSVNPRLKSKWTIWHLIKTALESDSILIKAKRPAIAEKDKIYRRNV